MKIFNTQISRPGKYATVVVIALLLLQLALFLIYGLNFFEPLILTFFILTTLAVLVTLIYTVYENGRLTSQIKRTEAKTIRRINWVSRGSSILQINSLLNVQLPLIWQDNYMIGPDVLLVGLERVLGQKDLLILECGAGISSLVFGYAIKKNGSGKVIALENDEFYTKSANERIARHGLSEYVEVVYAPLKEFSFPSGKWLWYNADQLLNQLDRKIDVVLVDGPPGNLQDLSRYPALPVLNDYLSNRAILLIDDYGRTDEKQIVENWLNEFDGFELTEYRFTEKGAAILSRNNKV